jgi:hypothetical protein
MECVYVCASNMEKGKKEKKDIVAGLTMIPERESFHPGDTAVITVTNNTDQNLTFSDSALGARLFRADNAREVNFVSSPTMVSLKPGQNHKIGFVLSEPGDYIVKIRTAGVHAETHLKIESK